MNNFPFLCHAGLVNYCQRGGVGLYICTHAAVPTTVKCIFTCGIYIFSYAIRSISFAV